MKKLSVLSLAFIFTLGLVAATKSEARPQYKAVIDTLETKTDAEKEVQMKVKEEKCVYCHDKKDKKIRNEYGLKLHTALGKGDPEKYEYDKALWKKEDGKYSDKAIELLRTAINDAAKEGE
ncbi:MAG: hypothetical protein KDA60_14280 [Planctomycetales bacterium]|nr:hypothetical protein [Planctomycetales bacterium]